MAGESEIEIRQVFEAEDFGDALTPELKQQEERLRAQSAREALRVDQRGETTMTIQPYLFFDGRCEEAIEFYRRALGAEVEMMMRFKECPSRTPNAKPDTAEKVMHASLQIGGSTVLASDGRCTGQPSFQGFALSLTVRTRREAERMFGALGEGGQVQMPLGKTFFSPRFGMVADRFGVSWMVYVAALS